MLQNDKHQGIGKSVHYKPYHMQASRINKKRLKVIIGHKQLE